MGVITGTAPPDAAGRVGLRAAGFAAALDPAAAPAGVAAFARATGGGRPAADVTAGVGWVAAPREGFGANPGTFGCAAMPRAGPVPAVCGDCCVAAGRAVAGVAAAVA